MMFPKRPTSAQLEMLREQLELARQHRKQAEEQLDRVETEKKQLESQIHELRLDNGFLRSTMFPKLEQIYNAVEDLAQRLARLEALLLARSRKKTPPAESEASHGAE